MKKNIIITLFALLTTVGCTASLGLGTGIGGSGVSTSASVSKEVKSDKKKPKKDVNSKTNKKTKNTKEEVSAKRTKQVREDGANAISETEVQKEKQDTKTTPIQRIKQVRN